MVKKLTTHAATHGVGQNYLVMASAGSGKSNTIGWLAHRLSDLHADTDPRLLDTEALANSRIKPGEPVFDKVIVITDRHNLDAQLRETVGSFSQTDGLVVKVDEKHGAKSEQLARALSRDTGKIVTVTLHSFPALLDYIKRNPTEIKGTRFAIVVDEAHSSPDLERLHLYGRYLLNRLPRRADGGVDIVEVDLSHLRVAKTGEHDVSLSPEGPAELKGFGDGAGGAKEAEKSLLSELIDKFNAKFGTEFTEEDVLPAFNAAKNDPKVRAAAVVNDEDNFGVVFDKAFSGYMMDHVSTIDTLGKRYFGADRNFKSNLDRSARRAAWRMIRSEEGLDDV